MQDILYSDLAAYVHWSVLPSWQLDWNAMQTIKSEI
jgi:hypothetical protein